MVDDVVGNVYSLSVAIDKDAVELRVLDVEAAPASTAIKQIAASTPNGAGEWKISPNF